MKVSKRSVIHKKILKKLFSFSASELTYVQIVAQRLKNVNVFEISSVRILRTYGKKEKELKIIKILKKLLDTKKTVLYN